MLSRRVLLQALAAFPLAGTARAQGVIELDWKDLAPTSDHAKPWQSLTGVVQHNDLASGFSQPQATAVTEEFNGKRVRIPGFIVPLDLEAKGVTDFILVPYVGACIHVPPPPANQLIFVRSKTPYEFDGLFEPVQVTGTFSVALNMTELANIGYQMQADRIVPYKA